MITFLEIIEAVEQEGRITNGDLRPMVKRIINEINADKCRRGNYQELIINNEVLAITTEAQSYIPFPVGFDRLIALDFSSNEGISWWRIEEQNQYRAPYTQGMPRWYYRASGGIYIYPFSEVAPNCRVQITYYKAPAKMVLDTDVLTVEDLYSTIVKETIARVLRYHDKDGQADSYVADAKRTM